jgi:hypothetical protein
LARPSFALLRGVSYFKWSVGACFEAPVIAMVQFAPILVGSKPLFVSGYSFGIVGIQASVYSVDPMSCSAALVIPSCLPFFQCVCDGGVSQTLSQTRLSHQQNSS